MEIPLVGRRRQSRHYCVAIGYLESLKFPPTRGSVSLDDAIKNITSSSARSRTTHIHTCTVDSLTAAVEPTR